MIQSKDGWAVADKIDQFFNEVLVGRPDRVDQFLRGGNQIISTLTGRQIKLVIKFQSHPQQKFEEEFDHFGVMLSEELRHMKNASLGFYGIL